MTDNLNKYILDILSILLPGALLMAVLAQYPALRHVYTDLFPESVAWINAVVLVGLAYILGHFIFFMGSFIDDLIFDNVKKYIGKDQRLLNIVAAIKIAKTGIREIEVMNAFKWSCAWLLANQPVMYAVVERHVAESKFFRSLIIVLFIAIIAFSFEGNVTVVIISALLIVLAVIRYLTQRQKCPAGSANDWIP